MGMNKIAQVESQTGRLSKDTNKHHHLCDGGKESLPKRLKKRFKRSRISGEMVSSKTMEVGFAQKWPEDIIKSTTCQKR